MHTEVDYVVYYESIKRELKTKPIYECRCDERPNPKAEESTRLACTGVHDKTKKKFDTILDFCVSSLRRGHANLLCIVPILVYVLPKQVQQRCQTLAPCLFSIIPAFFSAPEFKFSRF